MTSSPRQTLVSATLDRSPAINPMCRACETTTTTTSTSTNHNRMTPDPLLDLSCATNQSLLRKLRTCVDTHIDIADGRFPRHLCRKCAASVEAAYRFRIRCEYLDQKWRDALQLEECWSAVADGDTANVLIVREEKEVEELAEDGEVGQPESPLFNTDCDLIEEEHLIEADTHSSHIDHPSDSEYIEFDELSAEDDTREHRAQCSDNRSEHCDNVILADALTIEDNSQGDKRCAEGADEIVDEESAPIEEYIEESLADDSDFCSPIVMPPASRLLSPPAPPSAPPSTLPATSPQRRFTCPICHKSFSKRYHLKNHQTIHATDGPQFPCPECGKRYSNQGNLDRHVRVFHRGARQYRCAQCGKQFSQSWILKQHAAVHTERRDYACDLCEKRFKTREYMQLHRNRHSLMVGGGGGGGGRQAPALGRRPTAASRASKATAAATSGGVAQRETVDPCPHCGKRTGSAAAQAAHLRTHTGEKPYECAGCGKRFSFAQSLKTHLLQHTGEKPYGCEECGLRFRQIGHLNGHRLTHSGRKEHECGFCGKRFALRGNLRVHERLHTGETPYRCGYCERKFNDSNGLKRHVLGHVREGAVMGRGEEREAETEARGGEEAVEETEEALLLLQHDGMRYEDMIAYDDGAEEEEAAKEADYAAAMTETMIGGEEADQMLADFMRNGAGRSTDGGAVDVELPDDGLFEI